MELDDIKLIEPEDLSDEEKAFLKENKDELTDEEKKIYKDVLGAEEEEEEEEDKPLTFKDEAELDTYLDKRDAGKKKKKKEKKPEEEEEEESVIFKDDYKPKGYGQFARDLLKELPKSMKKVVRDEIGAMKGEDQKRIQEINREFDTEIETLRKTDKDIPAAGTKERKKFDKDLAQTMVDYPGVMNMIQAYKIYKATKGAGGDDEEKEKKKKALAKKVGKSGPGGKIATGKRTYKTTATRSLDDAHEAALKKLEEGD